MTQRAERQRGIDAAAGQHDMGAGIAGRGDRDGAEIGVDAGDLLRQRHAAEQFADPGLAQMRRIGRKIVAAHDRDLQIHALLAHVLPTVAREGIRPWMPTRFGCRWRVGVTSVITDRAAGAGALTDGAFCMLLLPSHPYARSRHTRPTLCVVRSAGCGQFLSALSARRTPAAPPARRRGYSGGPD